MAYEFDFANSIIEITSPQYEVSIIELIDAIREAEDTETGITYSKIADASGGESLGGDVEVGITLELLGNWQIHFWAGDYVAKVAGGNLVGGPDGDPVAYSAGVQVLLIQSAASTIVSTGEGLSSSDRAVLETARDEARKARKMLTNNAIISEDRTVVTIYDDDGESVLHQFDISDDKLHRTIKT